MLTDDKQQVKEPKHGVIYAFMLTGLVMMVIAIIEWGLAAGLVVFMAFVCGWAAMHYYDGELPAAWWEKK